MKKGINEMSKIPIQEFNFIVKVFTYILSVVVGLLLSLVVYTFVSLIKRVNDLFKKEDTHETRISTIEGKCESNHKGKK